jgi:hypothetical protein
MINLSRLFKDYNYMHAWLVEPVHDYEYKKLMCFRQGSLSNEHLINYTLKCFNNTL